MSKLRIEPFIIDPLNDFMQYADGRPYGVTDTGGVVQRAALPVKGAVEDMQRGARFIDRFAQEITAIRVVRDKHPLVHVGHPAMWVDKADNEPAPGTPISADDVRSGVWLPYNPDYTLGMIVYLETLEKQGNHRHMIWNSHCLNGTWGHAVQADLAAALWRWEARHRAAVDYTDKGMDPFREQYGAFEPEVADPHDPSTSFNFVLLNSIIAADIIPVFGIASSHCVAETMRQAVRHLTPAECRKFVLLTDCMSPVDLRPDGPSFHAEAKAFFEEMDMRGVQRMTSEEFKI